LTPDTPADNSHTITTGSGRRFSLRWLLLVAAFLLLFRLGYAPFWNPDEGRYAAASMEMIAPLDGGAPDWVVPSLNTLPRLNKPPLVYWATGVSFTLFGQSEWAARLVPALAAIAIMLVLWQLGGRMFGEKAGILGGLIWATSAFPFAMARTLNTDMLLCLSTALTLCGMWLAVGATGKAIGSLAAYLLAGAGMGIALLAKGPVGMALPLAIGFFFLTIARRWDIVCWGKVSAAVAVALAIGGPWYWAIEGREPGFLHNFILGENLGRFSGKQEYHDASSFWFYLPVLLFGLLPWVAFLPHAVARWQWAPATRRGQLVQWALWSAVAALAILVLVRVQGVTAYPSPKAQKRDLQLVNTLAPFLLFVSLALRCRLREAVAGRSGALLFLWLWALVPVVLFSLSSTKLITYVLLSFPAFALLLGEAVSSLAWPQWHQVRRNRWAIGIMLGLNAVLAAACLIVLTRGKSVPRDVGLPWAVGGAAVLLFSAALCLWAWRGATPATLVRRVAGTQLVAAALLFLFLIGLAGRISPYEDTSHMIQALRPHLREGDLFVEFKTFQPTAIYYLARPITVIDFVNTSGLDEQEFSKSQWFPPRPALRQLLQGKQRVYALVRWKHIESEELKGLYLVGRNNDFHIFSNQPRPAGFDYDFTAPGKRIRKIPPEVEND